MSSQKPTIAVVILTFDEEKNIEDCLNSIGDWADQIFVVDSYSTDATIDRLLARNDLRMKVVQHAFTTHSEQWNWALENLPITAEWTLKLDADERVTLDFKDEVGRRLSEAPPILEGLWFRRRFVFLGRRLGPVGTIRYDLRLWRTGRAWFDNSVLNEHALVKGETDRLRAAVDHIDNKSITEWLDKHNRYASIMALAYQSGAYKQGITARLLGNDVERTKLLERLYLRMPFKPFIIFVYMYVVKLGLIDGVRGLHYCILRALFFYFIHLKMLEARLTGRAPEVIHPPRGQPDPRLANHLTRS